MKYFIKTFGCATNTADSERIAGQLEARGMKLAKDIYQADYVVINTCMVRRSAEDRIYGLLHNIVKLKCQMSPRQRRGKTITVYSGTPPKAVASQKSKPKIVVTGCLVGMAICDSSGKMMANLRERFPMVDEFLPIEEIGFDNIPLRINLTHALVPISNGCNNCCTYCVVPYSRGREISRPYEEIINECKKLKEQGYKEITLLGQNVNSYGSDLIKFKMQNSKCKISSQNLKIKINGHKVNPVLVKHLGRQRIPTLFPYLLEDVAKMGFEKIDFISSNPWDFSDELIEAIARNPNITREIHLPVQSGDDDVLKRMNRWYTSAQYLALISKITRRIGGQISKTRFSTDIIVGFPGETEEQFENTVKLCKAVGFYKAYIAMYSDRPMTAAHKIFKDDVPYVEKKRRWQVLEDLINKPNLKKKQAK